MLNRTVLVGRLTKDPELRYTPNGVAVTNLTLAVERNFKNAQGEKETDFINCVIYRQSAEFAANYLAKGKLAAIDGRIQVRNYTDKESQKRYVTEVVGDNIYPLSPREREGSDSQPSANTAKPFGHEVNLDDDIPF
jgi:single-strand DNA-binding protein